MDDSSTASEAPTPPAADAGAELPADTTGATDAGPSAPAPDGASEGVLDRCVGESCGERSALPKQQDLFFLEDMGDGWQRLMEIDWEVAAGSEGYRCMTFTIPNDVYVTAFAPQTPVGTHHVTFDVAESPRRPDGVYACEVGSLGERKLQGGGIGSVPTELPDDVAMPLRTGQQLFMNLHLFNPGDQPLRGRSGMWIKTLDVGEVRDEAEVVLVGPLTLDIPIGLVTQSGTCTIRADATLYGVAPHMHQTGVHLRATVTSTDGSAVDIYDAPYDFNHQLWYRIDEIPLHQGDRVDIECTYLNETDAPLQWGDSALQEMCFLNLGVYPAIGYGTLPCSE